VGSALLLGPFIVGVELMAGGKMDVCKGAGLWGVVVNWGLVAFAKEPERCLVQFKVSYSDVSQVMMGVFFGYGGCLEDLVWGCTTAQGQVRPFSALRTWFSSPFVLLVK
jgi:hypothetical protein